MSSPTGPEATKPANNFRPGTTTVPQFFASATSPQGYESKWNDLWNSAWTPWDRGGPSMTLSDLLEDHPDLFPTLASRKTTAQDWGAVGVGGEEMGKRPRALVPGSGRGHDVLLLASWGYDAYGLDISPAAAVAARENEAASGDLDVYRLKEGVPERGSTTWLTGNFFTFDFAGMGIERFDLIFDYTFLCALPLSQRRNWSSRMIELLAKPNGRLVCLEFPSNKPVSAPGPPWALPPQVYEALLAVPREEEVASHEEGRVKVEGGQSGGWNWLRRLIHIKPKRTHEAGTDSDGEVEDWISAWGY